MSVPMMSKAVGDKIFIFYLFIYLFYLFIFYKFIYFYFWLLGVRRLLIAVASLAAEHGL